MTLLNIGFIIIGVALVIWGADRLTEGASSLARGMRVPEIVIGLTIVAAGTSAPELFVSLVSALKGTSDLAVGNVIGSNVFNTLLIVGCSAAVAPIAVAPNTVKKDIPFAIVASLMFFILCFDDMSSPHLWGNEITRQDGLILLVGFLAFMFYTFRMAINSGELKLREEELGVEPVKEPRDYSHLWRNLAWIVIGLACLIGGSNLFVDGVTAVIHPLRIMGITIVDLMVMLISIGLMWLFAITKYYVSRREGWLLILSFVAYMGWLIYLL